jgi:hypothetical protein
MRRAIGNLLLIAMWVGGAAMVALYLIALPDTPNLPNLFLIGGCMNIGTATLALWEDVTEARSQKGAGPC